MRQKANSDLEPVFQFLCDPMLSKRPLLLAYLAFEPFQACNVRRYGLNTIYRTLLFSQETLKNAFLSSICFSYVRQRASCAQWRKEQFLSLFTAADGGLIDGSPSEREAASVAAGFPLGVDVVDLERTELWLFCGFLLCQHVVDAGKREAGEYRIWATLLQGMWVLPIVR